MTELVDFKRVSDNSTDILREAKESDKKYCSLAKDDSEAGICEIAKRSGYSIKRDAALKGTWPREDLAIKGILFYQLDFFLQK